MSVTVNNAGVSTAGLRVAYGFDEGRSGTAALDSSDNRRDRHARRRHLDDRRPFRRRGLARRHDARSTRRRSAPSTRPASPRGLGPQADDQATSPSSAPGTIQSGGPMIWVDHVSGHYRLTLGASLGNYLDSGVAPPSDAGSTSPRRTTARSRASTSTASKWRTRRSPATSATPTPGASAPTAHRRQASSTGSSTTSAIYDRALSASEIQADMASADPARRDAADGDVDDARRRRDRRQRRRPVDGDVQRADAGGHDHGERPSSCKDGGEHVVPRRSHTTRRRDGDADAADRARVRHDLHGDRRAGRRRQRTLAGNALAADVSWSFTTEASPPPLLVVASSAQPVRHLPRRDPPQRGPERVHDDRHLAHLAASSPASTSSSSADASLTPRR